MKQGAFRIRHTAPRGFRLILGDRGLALPEAPRAHAVPSSINVNRWGMIKMQPV